jgi:hypothetical protein
LNVCPTLKTTPLTGRYFYPRSPDEAQRNPGRALDYFNYLGCLRKVIPDCAALHPGYALSAVIPAQAGIHLR